MPVQSVIAVMMSVMTRQLRLIARIVGGQWTYRLYHVRHDFGGEEKGNKYN